jgi:hypothetical protein
MPRTMSDGRARVITLAQLARAISLSGTMPTCRLKLGSVLLYSWLMVLRPAPRVTSAVAQVVVTWLQPGTTSSRWMRVFRLVPLRRVRTKRTPKLPPTGRPSTVKS